MVALPQQRINSIIAGTHTQSPAPDATSRSKHMAWDIVHRGRKIQVAVDRSIGANGQTIQRDVVLHPGAVAILPLVDDEHICLLRNHRFILEEVLWEIPAGTLEAGEAIESAAVRELAEETGYRARHW